GAGGRLSLDVEFYRLLRGMSALFQRPCQTKLAQGKQAQHGVVDTELLVSLQSAQYALAQLVGPLPQAAGGRAEQCGRTQAQACGERVQCRPRHGARRHALPDMYADILERLRVEEIHAPTLTLQRMR